MTSYECYIDTIFKSPQPTMGAKTVETLCYFRVLKANFTPQLYDITPTPKTMLDFLSLELAPFLCNIEKGEGRAGSQCKPD